MTATPVYCVSIVKKDGEPYNYKSIYTNASGFGGAVQKVEAAYPDWKVSSVSFEEDFFLL